jgi:hypothetical protein
VQSLLLFRSVIQKMHAELHMSARCSL